MGCCASVESDIACILPSHPGSWTQKHVIQWLRSQCDGELSELIPIFKLHQISGVSLVKLSSDDLRDELNIKQYGLREQFLYQRDKLLTQYANNVAHTQTQSNPIHETTDEHKLHTEDICHEIVPVHVRSHARIEADYNRYNSMHVDRIRTRQSQSGQSSCAEGAFTPNDDDNSKNGDISWEIVRSGSFNPDEWMYFPSSVEMSDPRDPTQINRIPKYRVPDDYYVLEQYKNYCYIYGSRLVIDGYYNEMEQMNDIYHIVPSEVRNICYSYYFLYEWHIVQFAYDVSRIVDLIDVTMGKGNTRLTYLMTHRHTPSLSFTRTSLIEIVFNNLRNKYRLDAETNNNVVNTYCKELMSCGFLSLVAVPVRNPFNWDGMMVDPESWVFNNDAAVQDYLYNYCKSQKALFDKYQQFVQYKLDRNAWTIGTAVNIYSHVLRRWLLGHIIAISEQNPDHISVEYGKNPIKYVKNVERNNTQIVKSTKAFILNRDTWSVGSDVEIWNDNYALWFPAKIESEFNKQQFAMRWPRSLIEVPMNDVHENEIQYRVRYETMFDQDGHRTINKWSPEIRVPSTDVIVDDNVVYGRANPRDLVWIGFIRQQLHDIQRDMIPTDIIRLIHQFGEYHIHWTIENDKMHKLLSCGYQDIMIGPQVEAYDGISYQLTLCPQDGGGELSRAYQLIQDISYIVCYLEMKHIPWYIKTITFTFQLYCSELQHDYRRTVFYDTTVADNVKCNAWSWGKQLIPSDCILNYTSLHIECSVDIIHVQYKPNLKPPKQNLSGYYLSTYLSNNLTWNISDELLNKFKRSPIDRTYFADCLSNSCWMISCEPRKKEGNDTFVYVALQLMKLPIGRTSLCATASFGVHANSGSVFSTKRHIHGHIEHEFKLNMNDSVKDSHFRMRVCKSSVLKCLSSLTFVLSVNRSLL
eukprot:1020346_1